MTSSNPPQHEITRPLAQVYNPASGGNNAPLAALLSALSNVAQAGVAQPSPVGTGTNDAQFTAQLCSALSLRPDSLFSNFCRRDSAAAPSASLPAGGPLTAAHLGPHAQPLLKAEDAMGEHSSAIACNSRENFNLQGQIELEGDQQDDRATQDTSSNENPTASTVSTHQLKGEPLTEEAKKKRRQEINRESARRVRKRKSLEHHNLQQRVVGLQTAAASAAADQAVIMRYASELAKERDALLQRATDLESKWIAAECRNVVLRQKIAEIKGVSLHEIAADTGHSIAPLPAQQQEQ